MSYSSPWAIAARAAGCRITWYVWAWNGTRSEKMRHTSTMRGTWGWDATCSCGWESSTGGATRGSVERDVDNHKMDVWLAASRDAS